MIHDSLILTIVISSISVLSVVCGLIGISVTAWCIYRYIQELRVQEHFSKPSPIRDDMMREARGDILIWAIWTTAFWIIAVCMDIYVI